MLSFEYFRYGTPSSDCNKKAELIYLVLNVYQLSLLIQHKQSAKKKYWMVEKAIRFDVQTL